MKKFIPFLLFTVFVSCSMYKADIPYFDNISETHSYVAYDIKYKEDPLGWKAPETTVYLGHGDCNDKAGLLAYMFEKNLGIKNTIIYTVRSNEKGMHCIVEADGVFYEPTSRMIYTNPYNRFDFLHRMTLKEYLYIADKHISNKILF